VGPPRSAIHGRARLTRHPCRVAHCAEPALGLPRGQEDQKQIKSRSEAAFEPTLLWRTTLSPVGAELARDDGLTADRYLPDVPGSNCRSEPARDNGLIGGKCLAGVHIHSCGYGCYWFRPYGQPFQGVFFLEAFSTRSVDT